MHPYVREIQENDPLRAFAAVEHLPYSLLLDSADLGHRDGRYSFIVSHPIETIEVKNGVLRVTNWDGQAEYEGDPLAMLQSRLTHWRDAIETVPDLPPFQGGAAGVFGYDLGRSFEVLPVVAGDNSAVPDMAVGIYDQVIAFDHEQGKSWIITHADQEDEAMRKQDFILDMIAYGDVPEALEAVHLDWRANFTREGFEGCVARVIDYIRAGDVFQVNVAQRFDASLPADFVPFAHYLNLRRSNPAPFGCYFNLGDVQISSASPERFLAVKGGEVETRPIKGTMPVDADAALNAKNVAALENSEKDHAENTMIVDLLRNDLSRVCRPDSVVVDGLCEVETFASVHHLVSTIRGTLLRGRGAIDLLRACFPGGSITGAPKIRAQEIIEELEPTRRGAYTGSIGYIGFDGTMDSNILIRSLVYEGGGVSLQSGGGITINSDPAAEYQETLDKARAMFASFALRGDECS
ncbi:MAG: aminodeoxychorismate synthase component I [Alphaproteobacteria bacterium]